MPDDERIITLFASESRADQAARLHALKADPNTTYFAGDDHDRPDLPAWPLPADVWVWSVGNIWVATVAGFHADDWWEGSDDEDFANAPRPWYRPISDVPTIGRLSHYTRGGEHVMTGPFSTQLLIDADMTEHGWEIALRFTPEDAIANYSDVSDADLPGIIGDTLADALLTERGAPNA